MKSLFIQKNTAIIITSLFFLSSLVGASSLRYEKLTFQYEKIYSTIEIQFDESINKYFDISGNQPPETPDINGPTTGKPGIELNYSIVSIDPEENDIVYCFDWGDDSGEICIGPFPSGEEVPISHTWEENGTYTITVKASDILGAESGNATLTVKISTSRALVYSIITLFERLQFFKKLNKRFFDLLK